MFILLSGCVTEIPAIFEEFNAETSLAVGRVVAVTTGARERMYPPELRTFELVNRQSKERFRVDVQSDDQQFTLSLPPGEYLVNRIQISEGPFLSMAQTSISFVLKKGSITYLGTWRFGVDSPRYGRIVVLSMVVDEHDKDQAEQILKQKYPAHDIQTVMMALPEPAESEARLYEVLPYPRYPRYFQRHFW